jgi:hypothetical protein
MYDVQGMITVIVCIGLLTFVCFLLFMKIQSYLLK